MCNTLFPFKSYVSRFALFDTKISKIYKFAYGEAAANINGVNLLNSA